MKKSTKLRLFYILWLFSEIYGQDNEAKCEIKTTTAYCEDRSLTAIPKLSNEIKILNIESNILTELKENIFVESCGKDNSIQKVNLKNCSIERIDAAAFYGLSNMKELDLSLNKIELLTPGVFQNLTKLVVIRLNDNLLEKLDVGVFEELVNLQQLYLHNNRLSKISSSVFSSLKSLKTLTLNSNQLSIIRHDTETIFQSLVSLQLDDNPWKCDCNLRPFRDFVVNRHKIDNQTPVICLEPPNYTWTGSNPSHFACPPAILEPLKDDLINSDGETITMICKASGNPLPDVEWMQDSGIPIKTQMAKNIIVTETRTDSLICVNLTISNLAHDEKGNFTCVARNGAGIDSKTVTLQIEKLNRMNIDLGIENDLLYFIIGVVALVTVLIIVLLICCCVCKKKKNERKSKQFSSAGEPASVALSRQSTLVINEIAKKEESKNLLKSENTLDPFNDESSTLSKNVPSSTISPSYTHSDSIPPLRNHDEKVEENSLYSNDYISPVLFKRKPVQQITNNMPGYVVMPRKGRVPSAISNASYMSVGTLGQPKLIYDTFGTRTTADGSSHLSLNKMGLDHRPPHQMNRRFSIAEESYGHNLTLPNNQKYRKSMSLSDTEADVYPKMQRPRNSSVSNYTSEYPRYYFHTRHNRNPMENGQIYDTVAANDTLPKRRPQPPPKPIRNSVNRASITSNVVIHELHGEGTIV